MIGFKVDKHKQHSRYMLIMLVGITLFIAACGEMPAASETEVPDLPQATLEAEEAEMVLPTLETLQPIESAPSDGATPITTRLVLSKAPSVNEAVDLTFTISSVLAAPETTATIVLPEGAVLVEGDLAWTGDLEANEPQIVQATISFEREGEWMIEAKALHEVGNGDIWGDAAYIYLTVSDEGHFGFPTETPPDASGEEVPQPPSVDPAP